MARMSIDDKLLRDTRAIRLARRFGWRRQEAIGRLLDVYAVAYDRERDTLSVEDVDIAAEQDGFAAAMVEVDLAEQSRAGVRIRGAAERIRYLTQAADAGRLGGLKSGETRRSSARVNRGDPSPTLQGSGKPPDPVPDAVPDPVVVPDPEKISPSARAIPPTPAHGGQRGTRQPGPRATQQGAATPGQGATAQGAVPVAGNVAKPQTSPTPDRADPPPNTGTFNPDDARARGRLAEATYRRVSDALVAIAAELKLPPPLPFPAITPSSPAASLRDCQDRVREEGAAAPVVCDRVVANLIAQAREERSVDWLAEKSFTSGGWRTARAWMPGAAARRRGPQRGDPLPPAPAPKRPERAAAPIKRTPEELAELAAMADLAAEDPRAAVAELAAKLNATARAPPRSATQDPPDQQPDTETQRCP